MSPVEARLKALMVRGLDGDAEAHRQLLTALALLLRRFYGRRMGTETADLEDLVQETLLAVHTRRSTYDRAQPFTAWAYAIARYKLIDHYRRRRAAPTASLDDVGELFVDGDTHGADAARDLDRLLALLPAKQRQAIRYTRIEGLSVAEAAARTGQSESAVKVGVHRGLKALMSRLRKTDP